MLRSNTAVPQLRDAFYMFCIFVAAFAIRLLYVDTTSITQDESTMVLFAHGVLERGIPFIRQGIDNFYISTYELVPYPIAMAIALFGEAETVYRLPALLFSAASAVLIFAWARKLFDRRVAWVSAALYLVLPWSIYWGGNAFYPSQLQFFTLITLINFHAIVMDHKVQPWRFYAVTVAFVITYFTWEGSGFLLPVIFGVALILRWGQWYWLRTIHAWVAVMLMGIFVVGQLTYRTVLREPFLGVGSSRSDVSLSSLGIFSSDYDPLFYVNGLFSESHLIIGIMLLLSLFAIGRNFHVRFLWLVTMLVMMCLTLALGYYALRYFYFMLPLFILLASAGLFNIADRISVEGGRDTSANFLRNAFIGAILFLAAVSTTPWLLRPIENVPLLSDKSPFELRLSLRGFGFKEIDQALTRYRQEGDIVIVQAPFPFRIYTGIDGDYFLQTTTVTPIFYKQDRKPFYSDKWVGNRVLRSARELEDVLQSNQRVWLVSVPEGAVRTSAGNDLYESILRRFTVVKEVPDGRLLLWKNPHGVAQR